MKVKITGIQAKTCFWTGSGGSGFIFICSHIVTPMMMRPYAEHQERPEHRDRVGL